MCLAGYLASIFDVAMAGLQHRMHLPLQAEACSCLQSGLPVQVVFESQPRPDISLYVAPLGGQAVDAVMTLNAQAGKFNILSNVTHICMHK